MAKKKPKTSERKGKIPPPYPLAMVVCDNIHRDPGTGKPFLLGCFSVILARDFPATHPGLCVYIELTNGRGKIPFTLRLIDADEDREPVVTMEQEFECEDPRFVVQLIFGLANLTFPQEGEYRLQLFASKEFVMERRILVTSIPGSPQDE